MVKRGQSSSIARWKEKSCTICSKQAKRQAKSQGNLAERDQSKRLFVIIIHTVNTLLNDFPEERDQWHWECDSERYASVFRSSLLQDWTMLSLGVRQALPRSFLSPLSPSLLPSLPPFPFSSLSILRQPAFPIFNRYLVSLYHKLRRSPSLEKL